MITRRLARPLSAFSSSNWVCPSCARSSLLRQNVTQKRTLMNVPSLSYHDTFTRDGIPGFLSTNGYKLAWSDYQKMLVEKLNNLLAGEPYENMSAKALTLQFARDPMSASLFNHASMAHNNQFFFEGLSTYPQRLENCPALKDSLEETFGSIDNLRTTMLDTAAEMFGPGFVWLVWAKTPSEHGSFGNDKAWRVLTTYIAGTPYPEAGYRQQGLDMASNTAESFKAYQTSQQRPMNIVGKFGSHSAHGQKAASYPPGGTDVIPALCVNTWEHVYIYDWGLPGKRRFLADWWAAIDWHKVEQNAGSHITRARFQ